MTLAGLLIFTTVYFAAVATPGPGVALVISRSLGKGLDRIGWFIAGFLAGDFVLFVLAATGLALVAQAFENVFSILRYCGAAYLVYLAYKIWSQPVKAAEVAGAENVRESATQAFLSSFLLTLGNPKTIVFFLSIMPLAVDMTKITPLVFLELTAVIVIVLPVVLGSYALLADRARRLFRSEVALRRINRGTAGMMAGAAAVIASR